MTLLIAWACCIFTPPRTGEDLNWNAQAAKWRIDLPGWPKGPTRVLRYFGPGSARIQLATSEPTRGWWLQEIHAFGWPALSHEGTKCARNGRVTTRVGWLTIPAALHIRDAHELPIKPLFPGFAFNTAFYATILFTLFTAPPILRRHLRHRRGHCPQCNYDLRGLTTCPECGSARAQPASL